MMHISRFVRAALCAVSDSRPCVAYRSIVSLSLLFALSASFNGLISSCHILTSDGALDAQVHATDLRCNA